MEFEIINDILTSTVSKLFPYTTKPLNYLRFDEDTLIAGNSIAKSEIPKSSKKEDSINSSGIVSTINTHINNFHHNAQWNMSSSKKSISASPMVNYEHWKNFESKSKLEEAMRRLNVDEQKCKNKNMVGFSLDFLLNEKNKVKSELKKFDNEFFESFQRLPNRNEKESMRSIYMYYKNLKASIVYIQANSNNTIDKEKEIKPNTNNPINVCSIDNTVSNNPNVKQTNPNSSLASMNKPNDVLLLDNFDFDSGNKNSKKMNPLKDKVLTKTELIALEKEYESTKKEQADLKQQLHAYQKEFFEIHNRRVKYYKDIIGVEEEYQRYKNNKQRMKDIQEILLQYKNSKK